MTKYRVIGAVAKFAAGQILFLNKEQVSARLHRLEVVKGGKVIATGPVEFKRGESIGLEDKADRLPASLRALLLTEAEAKKLDRQVLDDTNEQSDEGTSEDAGDDGDGGSDDDGNETED